MADVKTLKTTILLRRATEAQWEAIASTFIPQAGEPCVTLDGKNKGQIKIGDGVTPWGELKYAGVVEGALNFKGSVQTKADLPSTADIGDIYQVIAESTLYIWDGDSWEIFHAIDLSNYATKDDVKALEDKITEQLQAFKDEIIEELNKYALKTELDVIKIYAGTAEDTSMSVDGVTYTTASEAINAVQAGGTIKMSDGLGSGEQIVANKKFTLDMNDAVIVDSEKNPISVMIDGDLVLTGSGSVECNKHGEAAIGNNGKLVIENGNYTRAIDVVGDSYYVILNHGEMDINSGVFEIPRNVSSLVANGYYDYASTNPALGYVEGINMAEPKLNVNGGTFISNFHVIKNDDGAILNINDGRFYGDLLLTGKDTVINGGYFEATKKPNLYVRKINDTLNTGMTYINGGTFVIKDYSNNIESFDGKDITVIIKGGKFSAEVPESFIAEGYEQNYENGYYVVTKKS